MLARSFCRVGGIALRSTRRGGWVDAAVPLGSASTRRRFAQPAAATSTATTTTTTVEEPEPEVKEVPGITKLFEGPSAPPQPPRSAAQVDAQRFPYVDPTCAAWVAMGSSRPELPDILAMISKEGSADAYAASYWAAHMARVLFFAGQSASALVAHTLSELLAGTGGLAGITGTNNKAGAATGAAAAAGGGAPPELKDLPAARVAQNANSEASMRLWECYGTWKQDLAWIREGVYKYPWDMEELRASQYRPDNVISRSARFAAEAAATLQRNLRRQPDPNWLRSAVFPGYYRSSFHYQSDGWLSSRSADIYEHSTETLFWGRQDAMQRTALVPVSEYLRQAKAPLSEMRLLEVAAGTGRFHTFIKDNWPDLRSTCSDLSPFYLARARDNMREWKRLRQPNRSLGGVDNTGVEFLQAAAEDLRGVPDASVDVVVCVYLFHEVPEAARRQALAEWHRVLKPGGLAVLTDSSQLGDRPERDHAIHLFGRFNEPYYESFIKSDLGGLAEQVGLVPAGKWVSSFTKTLSFLKPSSSTITNSAASSPDADADATSDMSTTSTDYDRN